MARDEALTGLARGFAFRLSEAMGVLPRDAVANEVKELDQEARGALRKHGVRFGQFTVFLPALLKPAPTRLRLVLWSLWNGLQEFPESPPPGLVTIPNMAEVPKQHYTLAGYHPAGTRAIRIDMLERLADILRQKDSRAGFEATPDMLSITGMTLDQFADLMAGLGYKGEKGERVKVKAIEAPKAPEISEEAAAAIAAGVPIPEEVSILAPPPEPEPEAAPEMPAEMEVFYTFTWAPKPRFQRPERNAERTPRPERKPQAEGEARAPRGDRPQGDRPQGDRSQGDRPKGDRPRGDRPKDGQRPDRKGDHKGGKPQRDDRQKSFEARPPRPEKPIDPDNPFAALLALKGKV
jgi:ATP-dependent RNA helicase SUPV3L1/SUV3